MFIGHVAVALAAKRAAPEVKLWQALLAAQFIDVLWPVFLLAGIERVAIEPGNTPVTPFNFLSYPWSHSLAMVVLWSVGFAAVYAVLGGTRRGACWLGALVLSHWVLDLLSHRPDLPLVPGGTLRAGLGLWYSLPGTVLVEGSLFAVGLALYVASTRARNRWGWISLAIFVAVFLGAYVGNLVSPPPPSVPAIGIGGLAGAALGLLLAVWVDRTRSTVAAETGAALQAN